MSKKQTVFFIFSLIRMFLLPILVGVLLLFGVFIGAYFWLPAWYGWLLLLVGSVGVGLTGFFLYHGFLFITFRGPYKQSNKG